MTMEQLRQARQIRPFKPFTICLADGRQMPVPHRDFLFVPPGASRTFVVYTGQDEVYKIADLLLVTSLDFDGQDKERPTNS